MSLKQLQAEDITQSVEEIISTVWSNGSGTIDTYVESTDQPESGYFFNVSGDDASKVEFSLAYGHIKGSGFDPYNGDDEDLEGYTPSKSIYQQYSNLIYPGEPSKFTALFSPDFVAINIERSKYKEKLHAPSLKIVGSGSNFHAATEEDPYEINNVDTFEMTSAGRLYTLVGDGYFLPDIGTIIIPGEVFSLNIESGDQNVYSSILLPKLAGVKITLNSSETLSANYYFIRGKNQEFNYSDNPSFRDPDNNSNIRYEEFMYNPKTYVTTVGLYNSSNELLAVAKLSKPLPKDFNREILIRAKLSY